MLFLLTSAAGSALWVVQLERIRKLVDGLDSHTGAVVDSVAGALQEEDESAYDEDAPPPAYSDAV